MLYKNNFVAFPTAFNKDGSVNTAACGALVEFYLSQGAEGFYLHGFTGEGWCMTPEMRKTWMQETVRVVNHRVPVLVSVGYGKAPEDAVELGRFAGSIGADGVSSVALTREAKIAENAAYFRKISEAAGIPFYVYWHFSNGNLNGGARLDAETMIDILLKEVPTFTGFKYTDSNFYYMQRIKEYRPELTVYTGVDQMCAAGHLMGSDGSIGALQACTCGHYTEILRLMNAGKYEEAFAMQRRANNIYAALDVPEVGGLIPGIKYILKNYYGVDAGSVSPLSPSRDLADGEAAQRLMERFTANIFKG